MTVDTLRKVADTPRTLTNSERLEGTAVARLTFLAPLRHRAFRLLFFGQVISNLGDWLNLLALSSLLLYRWNLGAGAWGAVLIALTLPSAVLGPAAGVWVDRWPRKMVMMVSDLARAVVVLGLVFAPNLPIVLALVAAAIGRAYRPPR